VCVPKIKFGFGMLSDATGFFFLDKNETSKTQPFSMYVRKRGLSLPLKWKS
jgi:hypothetical protein